MAFMLPVRLQGTAKPPATRPAMLPKPDRLDMLIFWIGGGADGIFVMAMTIMLSRQASLELANCRRLADCCGIVSIRSQA